jgi:hypothetical protein
VSFNGENEGGGDTVTFPNPSELARGSLGGGVGPVMVMAAPTLLGLRWKKPAGPIGPKRPSGPIGPKARRIPLGIKIGFFNLQRLWNFVQGDLGGILMWGFFLNYFLILMDFRKIQYAMPCNASYARLFLERFLCAR